jgi:hypothetical protein
MVRIYNLEYLGEIYERSNLILKQNGINQFLGITNSLSEVYFDPELFIFIV